MQLPFGPNWTLNIFWTHRVNIRIQSFGLPWPVLTLRPHKVVLTWESSEQPSCQAVAPQHPPCPLCPSAFFPKSKCLTSLSARCLLGFTILLLLCLSHCWKANSRPPWSLSCSPETCSLLNCPLCILLTYLMSPATLYLEMDASARVWSTCCVGPRLSTWWGLTHWSLTSAFGVSAQITPHFIDGMQRTETKWLMKSHHY